MDLISEEIDHTDRVSKNLWVGVYFEPDLVLKQQLFFFSLNAKRLRRFDQLNIRERGGGVTLTEKTKNEMWNEPDISFIPGTWDMETKGRRMWH